MNNIIMFREETKALTNVVTYIFDAIGIINEAKGLSLKASDVIDVDKIIETVQKAKLNSNPTAEELYELGSMLQLATEALELLKANNESILRDLFS